MPNPVWKIITRNDQEVTAAMAVPGGMIVRYVDLGPTESSSAAVAMVFVPCGATQVKEFIL